MAKYYPKPQNLVHTACRKPEYFQKKEATNSVHVVLAHVFHKLDTNIDISSENEDDSIFEGFVCNLEAHEDKDNVEI